MKFLRRLKSCFQSSLARQPATRHARLTVEDLEDRITPATPTWTAIGPAPITGDFLDAPAAADGAVSGRITAIAADPNPADTTGYTAYIGTAGGGVWEGTNIHSNSPTWIPLTDGLAAQINDSLVTLTVGAVATVWDPSTDSTVIYAGLGEPNSVSTTMNPGNANSQFYGTGIIKSSDGGKEWTLLGGDGSSNIFYRSAISKIVVSQSNPDIVYAAVAAAKNGVTGNEGIWKSIDGGLTWTNTTATAIPGSDQDMFSDLVMPDPNNPNLLFAAVGEPIGSVDNGVYETTNGGLNWSELTNLPNGAQQNNLQGVGRITLAASSNIGTTNNPQYRLYAAFVANSLTQNAIITGASESATATAGMYTVTIDYTGMQGLESFAAGQDVHITGLNGYNGNFEITSVGSSGGSSFLTYETSTAGLAPATNLQNATAGTPFGTLYQLGYINVTGVLSGTNPDTEAAWNVINGFDLPSASIVNDYLGGTGNGGSLSYQGYYDTSLIVDPNAADHIYVGGQDRFLSVNSATSSTPDISNLASTASGTPIHVDHHAVAIDPNPNSNPGSFQFTALDGSDGGIFEYDPNNTTWTDLNTNLQISQFYSIAANPNNPGQILGGVQDNGSLVTLTSGANWNDLTLKQPDGSSYTGGDGGEVYVNSAGAVAYVINTGKLQVSTDPFGSNPNFAFDGGTTPNTLPNLGDVVGLFPNEEYLMSPSNSQTLWLGTDTLYMTTDGGANWFPITGFSQNNGLNGWFTRYNTVQNGFTLDTTVVDSIGAPAASPNMLYVGARGGHFLITTNLSTNLPTGPDPVTWVESDPIPITPQNQAQLADLKFSDIQVDPSNPNIVFVTAANFGDVTGGAHVWMGVYNPATQQMAWRNISGSLPDVPAWSVQVQPPCAGDMPILYVGTDVGVFWSTNLGANWSSFGSGLPHVQARALSLYVNTSNPSQDELLLGSYGHGAYIAPAPAVCTGSYEVADFQGYGVQFYDVSTSTWQQLTPFDATVLGVAGDGVVTADFKGYGVQYFDLTTYNPATPATWTPLVPAAGSQDPTLLSVAANGVVVADFAPYGVHLYDPANPTRGWQRLTTTDPTLLSVGGNGSLSYVIGDFAPYGVDRYDYDSTNPGSAHAWEELTAFNAVLLAVNSNGSVYGDFQGYGVQMFLSGTSWQSLGTPDATALAVDILGEVAANLDHSGVYLYSASTGWKSLNTADASLLTLDVSGKVVADFPSYGVQIGDLSGFGYLGYRTGDAFLLESSQD